MVFIFALLYCTVYAQLLADVDLVGVNRRATASLSTGTEGNIIVRSVGLKPSTTYFLYLSASVGNARCAPPPTAVTSTSFSTEGGIASFNVKMVQATRESIAGLGLIIWSSRDVVYCGEIMGPNRPTPPTTTALNLVQITTTSEAAGTPEKTDSAENPNLIPNGGQKLDLPPIDPNYVNPASRGPISSGNDICTKLALVVTSILSIALF